MEGNMATSTMSQISARNQISGTVSEIRAGTAISVITVQANGHKITSAITNLAVQELGLRKNDAVVALIKSTEAILVKGDAGTIKMSARNRVSGQVTGIQKGEAMASVTMDAGQLKLTTAITRQAVDELELMQGDTVTALFKATEVMLQKT
jgi:molybdate transport system regulatory protein